MGETFNIDDIKLFRGTIEDIITREKMNEEQAAEYRRKAFEAIKRQILRKC